MNQPVLKRKWIREVDRRAVEQYGMTGLVLMENAGRGCVDTLMSLGVAGPVIVSCGKGNNGGDGFVIARHLNLRGVAVKVLLFCDPHELSGDAAANYQILAKTDVPLIVFGDRFDQQRFERELSGAAWIVDALLGTGALGEPRPPLDAVIPLLNAAPCQRFAVDVPSGFDCDTGRAASVAIQADHTGTFVAVKPGFLTIDAPKYVGQLHVFDIGAPRKLIDEVLSEAGRE